MRASSFFPLSHFKQVSVPACEIAEPRSPHPSRSLRTFSRSREERRRVYAAAKFAERVSREPVDGGAEKRRDVQRALGGMRQLDEPAFKRDYLHRTRRQPFLAHASGVHPWQHHQGTALLPSRSQRALRSLVERALPLICAVLLDRSPCRCCKCLRKWLKR